MKQRRIAYLLNVFPKLSETFIAGELAELRRRGAEVRILSLRRPSEELRHDIVAGAGLAERTSYDVNGFQDVLRRFRPQIVHAHFATEPTAIAHELAAELSLPFTFTAHGYDVYRRPPADFAARAAAAAAVVTVSHANARHIAAKFCVPASRIHVIPCGIDLERIPPNGRRSGPPHIVCVARLAPVKNVRLLLEACSLLRRRDLEFRCVVLGDGRQREELELRREQLGLEDVVELLGPAENGEVLTWWRRASVAALTSDSEGMPVSLMEAAACGVPAVATAVGGTAEVVEHGVTGLLTPPGDEEALAAALERLLRDRSTAARLGREARRRAEERFAVRDQVDRLLALWGRVRG